MNNNEVKNFYDEEAKYEKSLIQIKNIVEKIVKVDLEKLAKKVEKVDKENVYQDYIDLLGAVIGRKTNNYYYCQDLQDQKYYGLEVGKVYKMNTLNSEIQSRNVQKEVLNLKARVLLTEQLQILTQKLISDFKLNYEQGDGTLSTIDNDIIIGSDIEFLNNLQEYLKVLSDETGRLKVLVTERDIYALESAKEQYNKKSSIEKWFHKAFNREGKVIEEIAKKR